MLMNERTKYCYDLPLDLQLFAGEGGGDGGDGGGDGNQTKTYTEEEIQARIKEAKKAAAAEAVKKRFGDLADMDLEELRAAVALKKQADEEKNKGKRKDKDDDKIDPAELEAKLEEKWKAKEREQSEKMFKRMLTADVKVIATELEFEDWEDALSLADFSEVKEDDKGNLTGVKEALEELAKKKPHLLKQKQSGRFGADVKPNQQQKNDRLESLKKLAQNRGQTVQVPNDPWKRN